MAAAAAAREATSGSDEVLGAEIMMGVGALGLSPEAGTSGGPPIESSPQNESVIL